jgi:hypothetical protein
MAVCSRAPAALLFHPTLDVYRRTNCPLQSCIIGWTVLPAQQNAVVEAVSKAAIELPDEFIQALDLDPLAFRHRSAEPPSSPVFQLTRFRPLEEIEKALARHINALDLPTLASQTAQRVLDQARGRV